MSFARSPILMLLKSPLAWRLMEKCTYDVTGLLARRSSSIADHFLGDFLSLTLRSFLRALLASLISSGLCDSTQRL